MSVDLRNQQHMLRDAGAYDWGAVLPETSIRDTSNVLPIVEGHFVDTSDTQFMSSDSGRIRCLFGASVSSAIVWSIYSRQLSQEAA